MIANSSNAQAGHIRTDFVSYSNRAGLRLAACLDHTGELRERPWVVVAPKYGETKKSNLQLAYHLAANGLNVLRFDHTRHVGESEGLMLEFVLPGAVEDITASLDFLTGSFGVKRIIVVANSLSARCALRAAATDPRVVKFISVAGVVNLIATMSEIYREDILKQYRDGRRWGVTNFLGLEVHGDVFLDTLLAAGLHDLTGTIADAKQLQVPLTYFFAERDTWVRREEVEQVVASNPRARMVVVASAMHEVRENPRAAEQLFREIIWSCLHATPCPADVEQKLAVPNKKLLLEQNRRERERMRRSAAPTESETEFWSGYLQKYSILERSSDYQEYLKLLGRLCRPMRPGALVLDAGCGNGLFGLWVLHEAWKSGELAPPAAPVVYVGLDLTERGLSDAMAKHLDLRRPVPPGVTTGLQYAMVDFDLLDGGPDEARALPFLDGTFDLICCSLVLSYLKRPQVLLRELHRLLRPGGVLVTSSMKPHCDLSLIYRDSITSEVTTEEIEAGRNLLRAAGKIKLKEEIGHYAFFSENELAGMVIDAGFNVSETHLSLGEQAAVVKAGK
jgi:SAM-dependent methyltransferase/pimeloyl-ACP methyl ester carboxylesterase